MKLGLAKTNSGEEIVADYLRQGGFTCLSIQDFMGQQKNQKTRSIDNLVISPLTDVGEVAMLRAHPDFYLLALFAPFKKRYNQYVSQESGSDIVNPEKLLSIGEFRRQEEIPIDLLYTSDMKLCNRKGARSLCSKLDSVLDIIETEKAPLKAKTIDKGEHSFHLIPAANKLGYLIIDSDFQKHPPSGYTWSAMPD